MKKLKLVLLQIGFIFLVSVPNFLFINKNNRKYSKNVKKIEYKTKKI